MQTVNRIPELCGVYFQGVALQADTTSAHAAHGLLEFLQQQTRIVSAWSYYFPYLQQTLFVLLVETPFSCDALNYVRGLTGPGTPFFVNQNQ